ncbi:hypothetical protein HPB51_018523 [Rhipicephalus microplus]|uniref:Uncharacterized protein n=1 Tax=Rhipicephalus microplus TaxID=6941 RepID=A0A9J6EIS0_RHIMP|nr:hypothetical protein HPB51_018523 [Rhipicephalus microplus]
MVVTGRERTDSGTTSLSWQLSLCGIVCGLSCQDEAGVPDQRGTFINLGDTPTPEKFQQTLRLRPRFSLELSLQGAEKVALARNVSASVPEDERCRCTSECIDVLVRMGPEAGQFPDLADALEFFEKAFDHEQARKEGRVTPMSGVDDEYDEAMQSVKQHECARREAKAHNARSEGGYDKAVESGTKKGNVEQETNMPTASEALDAVDVQRCYFGAHEGGEDGLNIAAAAERAIVRIRKMHQRPITDFFAAKSA